MPKKARVQFDGGDEIPKPTSEEKAVAKYLRFNCELNNGKLVGMPVEYFVGSKAVDCLLASKWSSTNEKNKSPLFTNRFSAVVYCQKLLMKGMFHRAEKVVRQKPKNGDGAKKKEKKEKGGEEKKEKDGEAKTKAEGGEKKKRIMKLDMHEVQKFNDGDQDYYVWIYDPVSWKTFGIGVLVLLATIGGCLFPMWPDSFRVGAYYLSVAGIVFLGVFIALAMLRHVIFGFVWMLTGGRHHFWLLPNLTEDCGFFESFVPAYTHEIIDKKSSTEPGGGDIDENQEKESEEVLAVKKQASSSNESVADSPSRNLRSRKAQPKVGIERDDSSKESGAENGFEVISHADVDSGGAREEAAHCDDDNEGASAGECKKDN